MSNTTDVRRWDAKYGTKALGWNPSIFPILCAGNTTILTQHKLGRYKFFAECAKWNAARPSPIYRIALVFTQSSTNWQASKYEIDLLQQEWPLRQSTWNGLALQHSGLPNMVCLHGSFSDRLRQFGTPNLIRIAFALRGRQSKTQEAPRQRRIHTSLPFTRAASNPDAFARTWPRTTTISPLRTAVNSIP